VGRQNTEPSNRRAFNLHVRAATRVEAKKVVSIGEASAFLDGRASRLIRRDRNLPKMAGHLHPPAIQCITIMLCSLPEVIQKRSWKFTKGVTEVTVDEIINLVDGECHEDRGVNPSDAGQQAGAHFSRA
jgi:hypothetical protein